MLPPLYFIRHGETDWNAQGLIQGSIDTDLNARGRAQAQALAAALVAHKDVLADYDFIVSPQRRAADTMAAIAHAQGRDTARIGVEPRVRELEFGIWEGHPFWELKASPLYPADAETRYFWRPEGGESYEDGVARVDSLLAELARPTLIVAHGAIGRCLMGRVASLSPAEIVNLKTPQGFYCLMQAGQINWFDAAHATA